MVTEGRSNLNDFCLHDFQTGQKDINTLDLISLSFHIEQVQQNTFLHLTRVQTSKVLIRHCGQIREYVISVYRHIAYIHTKNSKYENKYCVKIFYKNIVVCKYRRCWVCLFICLFVCLFRILINSCIAAAILPDVLTLFFTSQQCNNDFTF